MGESTRGGPKPPSLLHEIRVPAEPASARLARLWAAHVARQLPPRRLDAAVEIVSELFANSLLHADLTRQGSVYLAADVTVERVRISVYDLGQGFDSRDAFAAHRRPSGEPGGLELVRRLSDRMKVDGRAGLVIFEIDGPARRRNRDPRRARRIVPSS